MVMTRAQWEDLQNSLPPEDRTSYEDYLASLGTNVAMNMSSQRYTAMAQAAGLTPTVTQTSAGTTTQGTSSDIDPQDIRDPKTGLTPAQMEAKRLLDEAVANANALGITTVANTAKPGNVATVKYAVSTRFEGTGKNRIKIIKFNDGTEGRQAAPEDEPGKTIVSTTYEGKGKNRVRVVKYSDGTTQRFPDPEDETKTIVSVTYEGKGKSRVKVTKYSDGTETRVPAPEDETKIVLRSEFLGSGANRFLRTFYTDGTYVDTPAPDTTDTGVGKGDSEFSNLLKDYQNKNDAIMAQIAAQQAQAAADAKAAAEAAAKEKRESAIAVLTDRFTRYGLASLVPKIRELAISGANESTITLQLQETEEYRMRFKANQDRIKKGLSVLAPGEYLGLEDSYRQILRAYGLRQFDTDAYVSQFISNDVSTAELSSRVQLAVQRVRNADPATLDMLNKYYKIGETDLVAYALDPETQFQKFERQVAAAEIGAAAELQGIKPGVAVAEQLAAQGVTQAEARRGYSTIADILPTSEKLSQIYGNVLEGYGLAEAEQEVFNSLASAQRKRRKLTEREIAAFSGTSGLGKTSLDTETRGGF
jgi:hypothetical protein